MLQAIQGREGKVSVSVWDNPQARHIVVIAHGYGEHSARYEHVAQRLLAKGASVWGPDHIGHGRSDGARALVRDFEAVVDDLHQVVELARWAQAQMPVILIGHSMGGLIATRYAQRHAHELNGLVLSGPAIGLRALTEMLLSLPEIPEVPIDPAALSRDPKVGEAYANDPLVYHGPMQRPTVEAIRNVLLAIEEGPGFGALPTLWVHGADDSLVPLADTRTVIEKLRGNDFSEHIYPQARHEVFNETNQDEVLDEVDAFIARATAR